MNPIRFTRSGSALPKVLLLILFLGALVGFFMWKSGYGITGYVKPFPNSTVDKIAFLRSEEGHDIYIIGADGKDETRLTDDTKPKESLSWSPDGQQLCYSGETTGEGSRTYQLFRLGSDGSVQMTRGSGSKFSPLYRPDGKQIAFLTGGAIKVVDINGKQMEQIYPAPHKSSGQGGGEGEEDEALRKPPIENFRWSPNGQSILGVQVTEGDEAPVVGKQRWWDKEQSSIASSSSGVMDPETLLLLPSLETDAIPLINTNSKSLGYSWMPEGKTALVALSLRDGSHAMAIFHMDETRLPAQGLMTSKGYGIGPKNPVVSPDGKLVAIEVYRMSSAEDSHLMGISILPVDPNKPIFIRDAKDADAFPITIKGATAPQWSSDGKRLLYLVDSPKGHDVWVANFDGTNTKNLTNGKGDNTNAVWSPAKK